MTQLFKNNQSPTLLSGTPSGGSPISVTDTGLILSDTSGLPVPGATGEYFLLTVEDSSGNIEIMKIVANNTGTDTLTIGTTYNVASVAGRGQEGTSAFAFSSGARCELRVTAGTLENLLQKTGGTMSGDLSMGGNDISNAILLAPDIRGGSLRGADNGAGNELLVPSAGADPTIGGNAIWHAGNLSLTDPDIAFVAGMILLWSGSVGAVPSGWLLCDGTSGTPNLSGRFVVQYKAADALYGTTNTAGSGLASVDAEAAHTHGGATGSHVLTEAEIPAHNHRIFAAESGSPTSVSGDTETLAAAGAGVPGESDGTLPSAYRDLQGDAVKIVEDTGGGTGHTHTISAQSHTHTLTRVRPDFYVLAYIIKT